jgi:hypothetical protein
VHQLAFNILKITSIRVQRGGATPVHRKTDSYQYTNQHILDQEREWRNKSAPRNLRESRRQTHGTTTHHMQISILKSPLTTTFQLPTRERARVESLTGRSSYARVHALEVSLSKVLGSYRASRAYTRASRGSTDSARVGARRASARTRANPHPTPDTSGFERWFRTSHREVRRTVTTGGSRKERDGHAHRRSELSVHRMVKTKD